MTGRLFTVGYQKLGLADLCKLAADLGALVVDVRSSPNSRRAGFSQWELEQALGRKYAFQGDLLGGRSEIDPAGIAWIQRKLEGSFLFKPTNVLLLCMEEAPGDCHRHKTICSVHFPEALHIYQGAVVSSYDLQEAIDSDTLPALKELHSLFPHRDV